jgi:MHS family proline/betaine transporter-like MFS transporter
MPSTQPHHGGARKNGVNTHHETGVSRQVVLAGIAGNVMEWYDFAVYGYFAPAIGQHFFPSRDPTASVIAAFGVFAAGFLMRPLGGLLFGYIGDRIGRQAALTLSVLAMAVPTCLIGLLPDYAQIGVAASALMVGLRLVQGLSAGGEYTTSIVFLVEGAAPGRRGLMGSWSVFGAVAGILLGSAVGAVLTSVVSAEAAQTWGWRVPFLAGLVVGLTGFYIRRHLPKAAARPEAAPPPSAPVREAFRTAWRAMLRVAGLNVLTAVGFYMMFVYVVTYLQQVVHVRAARALDINTINMVLLLLLMPTAGALSDRIGRKPLLVGAALGMFVFAWPLFWLVHHPDSRLILAGQMGFAVLIGLFLGVVPATMAEAFPARVRCSAVSVGYNLCYSVLGGTTPMVTAYLITRSHNDLSPAFYLMAAAAISLLVLLRLHETARVPLPL